jgi:hypothetical protein
MNFAINKIGRMLLSLAISWALINGLGAVAQTNIDTNVPSSNSGRASRSISGSNTKTDAADPLSYPAFKLLVERNIFNTRRSARYVPSDRPRERPSRTESFALVGVMSYEKGPFAFFEGSRSDYQKVLKKDDTIAGFKVAEIEPSAVKLTSPTNEVELHVGMQLRREDEGEWKMSQKPESLEQPVRSTTIGTTYQSPVRTETPQPAFPDLSNPETAAAIFSNILSNGLPQGFVPPGGVDVNQGDQLRQGSNPNSISTPQNPGNVNDALERLRRRREQENNP